MTVLVAGTAAVLQTTAAVRQSTQRTEELTHIQNACLSAVNLYAASSEPVPQTAELPIYNVPNERITVQTFQPPYTGLQGVQLTAGRKYRLIRLIPQKPAAATIE